MTLAPLRLLITFALLAVSLPRASAQSATTQDRDQRFTGLIREALDEFDRGNYTEALALFEQARALRPSARVWRGIAKTLFELRGYSRALDAAEAGLASDVEPLTGQLREDLEALRLRALRYIARLELAVTPGHAAILIDGRPLPPARRAGGLRLDLGEHLVEATAPGHHPARRRVDVVGGSVVRVRIALDPVPRVAPVTLVKRDRLAPFVVGGIGLATLGGLAGSIAWYLDRDDAFDRCADAIRAGARCTNAEALATGRDASIWAIGLSGAATAASAALFVYLLGRGRPAAGPDRRAAWLSCDASAAQLSCTGAIRW